MNGSFKLKPFRSELFNTARMMVERLRASGHKAFLVGGCVRDTVMGSPPKEYDITTSASPEEIMRIFSNTVPIGASFGVILILEGEYKFEVATFRQDESYSDGRHPDRVIYTSSERDDIKSGIVRTIGSPYERFNEDKLRMIRAIRFGARFNYEIEEETLHAIRKLAYRISDVSTERVREEIVKIITQKNPGFGLELLRQTGLLSHILPEVDKMYGVPQPPEFHPEGDVFTHSCLVLDKVFEITEGGQSLELSVGALLHDVGKPVNITFEDRIRFNAHDIIGAEMAEKICKRLRFSNKDIERIEALVSEHLRFKDVFNMKEMTVKRFLGMPYFEDHLTLHLADCLASHGSTEAYDFVKKKLEEFKEEEIKPKPILTGYDLIEMGYTPGPIFSEILESLEEAQLEGNVKDKEEAKKFVLERFPI